MNSACVVPSQTIAYETRSVKHTEPLPSPRRSAEREVAFKGPGKPVSAVYFTHDS